MKLSSTSLLELALGRWLVDYWSQSPTFSSTELREKLVQAVSSTMLTVASDGIRASGDDDDDDGGEEYAPGVEGSSAASNGEGSKSPPPPPPPPPPPSAAAESLTGWLKGRASEVRKDGGTYRMEICACFFIVLFTAHVDAL